MKLEVIEQKKIPLLFREEIKASITYKGSTPKTEEVCNTLSQQLKSDIKLIKIKKIVPKFGFPESTVYAEIYSSEEKKDFFKDKLGKKGKEKIQKAQEAIKQAAEKKEEPKAEPKEEVKEVKAEEVKEKAPAEETKKEEKTE